MLGMGHGDGVGRMMSVVVLATGHALGRALV
jgi:hypothetical protein